MIIRPTSWNRSYPKVGGHLSYCPAGTISGGVLTQ